MTGTVASKVLWWFTYGGIQLLPCFVFHNKAFHLTKALPNSLPRRIFNEELAVIELLTQLEENQVLNAFGMYRVWRIAKNRVLACSVGGVMCTFVDSALLWVWQLETQGVAGAVVAGAVMALLALSAFSPALYLN